MGYFDALASGCFKVTPDGRKLFFPWGVLGRGYAIASDQDYDRLRQQIKIYLIVAMVVLIGTAALRYYLTSFILAAVLIGCYLIWLPFRLRGLQPSDERLSVRDSMAAQASAHGTAFLWVMEAIALAFVAAGIAILVLDPQNWLIALAAILFFGLCSAVFTWMLLVRRRSR